MNKGERFALTRTIITTRNRWSFRLMHFAKILAISVVLLAWALVCVSIITRGPSKALVLVALGATLFSTPFYIIANTFLCSKHKYL